MRQDSEIKENPPEEMEKTAARERRRSARVFLQVAIFVQGVTADGHAFREKTETVAVNVHGALVHLSQDVRPNDSITLTHAVTGLQQRCRVAYTKPISGNIRAVGVEFENPSPRFWRIDFPPGDWKPFLD